MYGEYNADLPRSGEIYHHGIPEMRWYRRRFQNKDGSLTPAGRERYGVGPAREKKDGFVKRYAKRAGKAIERSIKTRHPWMMSDEDIESFQKRVTAENDYLGRAKTNKDYKTRESFVKDLVKKEVTSIADMTAKEAMGRFFDRDSMSTQFVKDMEDRGFMDMSIKDLEDAAYKAAYLRAIEGKGQLPKKDKEKGKPDKPDAPKPKNEPEPDAPKPKNESRPSGESEEQSGSRSSGGAHGVRGTPWLVSSPRDDVDTKTNRDRAGEFLSDYSVLSRSWDPSNGQFIIKGEGNTYSKTNVRGDEYPRVDAKDAFVFIKGVGPIPVEYLNESTDSGISNKGHDFLKDKYGIT